MTDHYKLRGHQWAIEDMAHGVLLGMFGKQSLWPRREDARVYRMKFSLPHRLDLCVVKVTTRYEVIGRDD